MATHYKLMVPNCSSPNDTIDVTAPFNEHLIATFDAADSAIVEQALTTAHDVFQDRQSHIPLPNRIEILKKTAMLMREQAEELALIAAEEGGKPLIDSRTEVTRAIDGVELCIETMRNQGGEVIPMGVNAASMNKTAFTTMEPAGVVVAISAFNHPLNLIVHQVAPAVAAGCPVIVKPAKKTPISCYKFVNLLRESGLPDEWCQALVIEDSAIATRLATDERVSFLSFIGSERVGWKLRSQLAPGARCALEHGGVAPVIVTEDADLDAALPKLVKAGFYHAGQVCVSVQRIYVHESIVDDFASRISNEARKLIIGDPTNERTEVGPLIDPAEIARLNDWIKEAVEEGAELLCGGKPLSESCFECTVLLNPPETVQVSTHEVFGPLVCVYSYSDLDEAIQRANSLPYSFQAAVFTQKIDTAMHVYKSINASAVMVNEHTAFRVDWMPFAGLKRSGHGIGGIPHTIKDMQVEKMLVIHSEV
jgi:acyl-CoA reductase-like NAD-dependent aldehyde dehydrogenase